MSRFDLSSPADFARLTMQTVTETLQIAGRDPAKWDLVEASFGRNGVQAVFHVFESKQVYEAAVPTISDSGGRRKVKYRFPYKDGQTTDDLGRLPDSFEVEAMIFGQNYLIGLQNLLNAINDPAPGDFYHPVMGKRKCVVEQYQLTHTHESRMAVQLRITFSEHNFSARQINFNVQEASAKGAVTKAIAAFQAFDNAVNTVVANTAATNTLKNRLSRAITDVKNKFALALSSINKTFNLFGSEDIPVILPLNQGGALNPDGTRGTDVFVTARTPDDPFNSVPTTSVIGTVLAASQIAKDVNDVREDLSSLIADFKDSLDGQGAVIFHDTILDMKENAILLQEALEKSIASSNVTTIEYTVPRLMSLREVAYLNGIGVNRYSEIILLNPEMDSVNYVPRGTLLKVPFERK